MKLNIVSARTGIQWVKLGVQTFFKQPLALAGLFFMYMAAVLVLFGGRDFEVVLPGCYLSRHTDAAAMFDDLWKDPRLAGVETHGSSFWLRRL